MATITQSYIVYDRANADGTRDVKLGFTALSNNSVERTVEVGPFLGVPSDWDEQAELTARAPIVLQNLAQEDRQWHIDHASEDTLWHDAGGFFVKVVPEWTSWDDASLAVLCYWLAQADKLALLNILLYLSHTSNGDLTALLDATQQQATGIRGDVQTAYDTSVALAAYVPWVDEACVVRAP